MNIVIQFFLHSEAGHFVLYILGSSIISGMPAPTAVSSIGYRWMFSTLNIIAANVSRASIPRVEKSPNFQDALNLQQASAGQPQTVAQPVVPVVAVIPPDEKVPPPSEGGK
jgi:hypothetical protein